MTVADHVRMLVRDRAKNRCEYCLSHQNYVMGRLQIDHVRPIAKRGADTEDNLCLACELCNQHKWTKTEETDPQTGKRVSLFNPRTQNWTDHFSWSADGTKIIGLTPCGRATVSALRLNNTRDADNNWLYYINLFDVNTTSSYTLAFDDPSAGPQPPVLQFIPDRSRAEGQQLGFIVESSDPNGTIPALSAAPLPVGVKFTDKGNGTATFDWMPAIGQTGKYDITFTASDGELAASRNSAVIITASDSDSDGMADYWEMKHFDTLGRDGTGDFDGDGISDLDEYLNGEDPLDMPGDINQDKQIDLTDAILALQIASGIDLDTLMNKAADVDGDGKIGLAEAVYVLQFVAE